MCAWENALISIAGQSSNKSTFCRYKESIAFNYYSLHRNFDLLFTYCNHWHTSRLYNYVQKIHTQLIDININLYFLSTL